MIRLPFQRVLVASIISACIPVFNSPALATSVIWNVNADGSWNLATNWSPFAPGASDDVTIDRPAGDFLVTLSSDAQSIRSLLTTERLTLAGGTLTVANTMQINNTLTFAGGTLANSTVSLGIGGSVVTTTSGGTLSNVQINGDLLLNTTSASVLVSGTTRFTAARLSANNAILNLPPGFTLNDLVQVEGASAGTRGVSMAVGGPGTVTLGASGVIRLAAGSGGGLNLGNSSVATLLNNGLITAEATGQILTISTTGLINNGTIQAIGGGTVNLANTFTNNGLLIGVSGQLNITGTLNNVGATQTLNATTGSWRLVGGTISGGILNELDGQVIATTTSGGTLSNVQINGDLLLNTTSASVLVTGTTRFTAARLSANNAILNLPPGFTLNDLVQVEGASAGTRGVSMAVGGPGTVTLGASGVIRLAAGSGGGLNLGNSSVATLLNNGLITAEATGQILTISTTGLINNGTIQAIGGGTVNLANTFTNNGLLIGVSGQLNITGTLNNVGATQTLNATTGSWRLVGGTISGGILNELDGQVIATTTSGGTLSNVQINGDILLNTTSASVLVTGTTRFTAARLSANNAILNLPPGFTLNDLVQVEGASAGTRGVSMAVGGPGTVTLGASGVIRLAAGAGGGLNLANNSVATLLNNGLITAEAAGPVLAISTTSLINNGTIQAIGGGTVNLANTFTNNGLLIGVSGQLNITGTLNNVGATQTLNATTGSWRLVGGTISGGTLNELDGQTLTTTISGGTLSNVQINGDLLLNTTSASVLVTGTTRFTAARLSANNAILNLPPGFTLNDLVQVEGVSGGARGVSLAAGGPGTVTLGASGVIRLAAGAGGGLNLANNSVATLLNNGLITAEAAGQVLSISTTGLISNGTLQALNGATLNIGSNTSTIGGTLQATDSTINFNGTTLAITSPLNLTNSTANFNATTQSAATIVGSGSISILGGATLTSDRVTLAGAWTIGGTHILRPNSSLINRTITINTLSLAGAPNNWAGRLDLSNYNLIVPAAGGGANVQNQIKQQAHLGAWNGTGGGITSTSALAAATTSTATALAYATGTQFTAGNGQTRLDSLPFNPTDTLILYTLAGDANMDQSVTFADFLQLQNHYNQQSTDWQAGDFNYDGSTTFADFLILQNNYNKTLTPASLTPATSGSVPEPCTILLLLIPWALTTRRRPQLNYQ